MKVTPEVAITTSLGPVVPRGLPTVPILFSTGLFERWGDITSELRGPQNRFCLQIAGGGKQAVPTTFKQCPGSGNSSGYCSNSLPTPLVGRSTFMLIVGLSIIQSCLILTRFENYQILSFPRVVPTNPRHSRHTQAGPGT